MNPALAQRPPASAFTLIEMLLAIGIAAVVLTAINAVFFGAIHLRDRTMAATAQGLPVDRAVETIKQDLLGIIPPPAQSGVSNLAGIMGTDATGVGMNQPPLVEIFTTTGTINDALPWGDIQKIDYSLQVPTNRNSRTTGKDLMRGVTRNLLTSTAEAPEQSVLIGDVQNFRLSYFDGTNWNDTWSVTLSNIPVAIKVFLTFVAPRNGEMPNPPIQFLVPIVVQSATNDSTNTTVSN